MSNRDRIEERRARLARRQNREMSKRTEKVERARGRALQSDNIILNILSNKILRIILVAVILVVAFVIWLLYINNYKKALSDVDYSMKSTSSVAVNETAYKFTTFKSENPTVGLVLYPDKKVEYEAYAPFANILAQKGVFVIVCDMPFNSSYLPYKRALKAIKRYPNIKKWYVGGFGKGGIKAGKCFSKNSKKFEGLVLLGAPCKYNLSKLNKKTIAVYGSLDGVYKPSKIKKTEKKFSKDKVIYEISGGNHSNFGYYKKFVRDKKATIEREEQIMEATSFIAGEIREDEKE
ncbi:MAG: alpha/beta hydrolase [Lachnospiraceae bacterium]|nr:alpha/beta hydrolase [Lachnospiraceae bacterium]